MNRRFALVVSLALASLAVPASAMALPHSSARGLSHRFVCGAAAAGYARCDAAVVTHSNGTLFDARPAAATTPAGYHPADLQSAYKLPRHGRSGQTVAIVDAYNDPNAARTSHYRTQYGLPACTTANGCFSKVNQTGGTSAYPATNAGWAARRSPSTSTWSRRSARTATSCWSRPPPTQRQPRHRGQRGGQARARTRSPTATAAASPPGTPPTTPRTTTTRASRSPPLR